MRILLIEDDAALCRVLQPALQAAGFGCDCCQNGADGLALLRTGCYDACILDRMLPELDGLTLLRRARAAGVAAPVLMLTALGQVGDRVAGLDAGADDYLAKPFDTRELLARLDADTFLIELYDRYAPVARAQGHTLTLRLPDAPLPALRADAARLEQLFAVLLHNAFEYAPAGTPVEITAALPPRGGLCVAVADHGPGVPDADKARIFDRFARGDPNRTDKAHFGLGLAVAAEIAALHGATLRVTDTPGGGATFAVCWGRGAAERGGKTVV